MTRVHGRNALVAVLASCVASQAALAIQINPGDPGQPGDRDDGPAPPAGEGRDDRDDEDDDVDGGAHLDNTVSRYNKPFLMLCGLLFDF